MRLRALVLPLLLLCLGAAPAFAHAVLLNSSPADRAILAESPAVVALAFNEPVQLTSLQLVGRDGTVLRAGETWPLTSDLTWQVPAILSDGVWLLSYSVISTDSHIVAGTIRLAVGADGNVEFGEVEAPSDGITEYPRLLMLAGIVLAAGVLLARAILRFPPSPGVRRLLVAATVVAILGSAGFILATASAAGGGSAALIAAIRILGPGSGTAVAALLLGTLCATRGYSVLAAVCGLTALIGLGLSGHAAGAPPGWLSWPVYLAHVAAAAIWLGSLVFLIWRRRQPAGLSATDAAPPRTSTLAAFSRYAPYMLASLVPAGIALIAIQAGSLAALLASPYGILLAIKIGLVLPLFALAAWNRWRLTRPALDGGADAERRLLRSIGAELGLFAAILIATALLGTAVPPRAYVPDSPTCRTEGPLRVEGSDIGLDIVLTVDPGCDGTNRISASIAWNDGRPLSISDVTLRVSLPDLGIEPFDVNLERRADGEFEIAEYDLPLPGEWRIETRVLLDQFTLRRVVFRVPVPPA